MPIALVTDVLHFVGRPSTHALMAAGWQVYAHDEAFTDAAARANFEKEIPGAKAIEAQEPADMVAQVVAAAGRIDAVISNDAYPAKRDFVMDANGPHMDEALHQLVTRPFCLAGHATRVMKDQDGATSRGKIIFVSSAAPLQGLANYSIYATARGATNAMVKSLALELGPHAIQVNALAPNFVESPTYFPKELVENPETLAKITSRIPLGRLAQPEEAGAVIAFLASENANFITGHVLPFAGGWA